MINSSQICLGLIGAGQRGQAFIKAVNQTENVRITRVGSCNLETFKCVTPDCQVFSDWRILLDPDALDGLIITTPSGTHSAIIREALNVDLPVLVEPPVALTIADAVTIKKLAREKLIVVNYAILMQPEYRLIKELVTSKAIGPVLAIRAYAGTYARPHHSVLWDWGTQFLALCIDLLGTSRPGSCSACVIQREREDNPGETIELYFDFLNTSVYFLLSSTLEQTTYYLAVYCEQLTLIYDSHTNLLTFHPPSLDCQVPANKGQVIPIQLENPLSSALSWFSAVITNIVEEKSNLDLEIDVVALLTQCQKFIRK